MKYTQLADKETIDKVMRALKARNIEPLYVEDRSAALEALKSMIPDGADVMTGRSKTLEEIGFAELLKSGNHKWHNLRVALLKCHFTLLAKIPTSGAYPVSLTTLFALLYMGT